MPSGQTRGASCVRACKRRVLTVGEGIAGIQAATFDDSVSSDTVKHSLDVSSRDTQQFVAKANDVGGTLEVGVGTAGVFVVKQATAPLQSGQRKKE